MREENRFVYADGNGLGAVNNSDMQCKNCVYVDRKPGLCKKYGLKPSEVIKGEISCEGYKPDTTGDPKDQSKDGNPDETGNTRNEAMTILADDGRNDFIVSSPPCVGCKYNLGRTECGKLGTKPEEVVFEHKKCQFRVKEQ